MKKLNKKGFTLIELLAVIVVLAIIMVIATQQVNGTIKSSRGSSFYETVLSIKKAAESVCATDNKITTSTLNNAVSASDVTISVTSGESPTISVKASDDGKFTNRDDSKVKSAAGITLSGDTYKFSAECPGETTATTTE